MLRRKGQCWIINKAVPGNKRVLVKDKENVDKYQDLKHEITRLWKLSKVEVIPVVIGALGMVTNQFQNRIGKLGITIKTEMLQKRALLGTARIIRRVMSMYLE